MFTVRKLEVTETLEGSGRVMYAQILVAKGDGI